MYQIPLPAGASDQIRNINHEDDYGEENVVQDEIQIQRIQDIQANAMELQIQQQSFLIFGIFDKRDSFIDNFLKFIFTIPLLPLILCYHIIKHTLILIKDVLNYICEKIGDCLAYSCEYYCKMLVKLCQYICDVFNYLYKHLEIFCDFIGRILQFICETIGHIISFICEVLEKIVIKIYEIVSYICNLFYKYIYCKLCDAFIWIWNKLSLFISRFIDILIVPIIKAIKNVFISIWDSIVFVTQKLLIPFLEAINKFIIQPIWKGNIF